MKKKYIITKEQAEEIRGMIKKYKETRAFRKLQAVMLIGEGESVEMVSQTTFYHPTYVYELIKQFCTQDLTTFVQDERGGSNHRNLTDQQESKIISKFEKKAIAGQVVNLSEMKKEYEQVRGKETANSTFYAFLERVDWRRVMPRGQHPKKASDEVIEASKKLTLSSRK